MRKDLQKEKDFFKAISKTVLAIASRSSQRAIIRQKKVGDYLAKGDLAVENAIVLGIKKTFPNDLILAEEKYHSQKIPKKGRIWIIDPICGTTNFLRGIGPFSTNIALAEDNKLIASCVVDHDQKTYIWSIGDKSIYVNDKKVVQPENKGNNFIVDVDLGALKTRGTHMVGKYIKFFSRFIKETEYGSISMNTSLAFAYVAIGKIDGYVSIDVNAWDAAAANFLIDQAGGVVTDIQGNSWTPQSTSSLAARDENLHKKLLELFGD